MIEMILIAAVVLILMIGALLGMADVPDDVKIGDITLNRSKMRATMGHKIGTKSDGTAVRLADVLLELSGEENMLVYNGTGSEIAAGALVYFSAYNTTYSCPQITKAQGTSSGHFAQAIVDEAIANGATGYVVEEKTLTAVDTDGASAVDAEVFLSDDTAGSWDLTEPTSTDKVQIVGRVWTKNATTGVVHLKIEDLMIAHDHSDNSQGGQLGDTIFAGTVTSDDATTPALICESGNTNTGYLQIKGKTSGGVKLTSANDAGHTLTLSSAAIASSDRTVTLPDPGGSDDVVYAALADTLTNKTMDGMVVSGGLTASGSSSNNFSGSTGTFLTSSGANTLSGEVTIADAANPDLNLASGKTNTGNITINGKTNGSLVITTADETAQAVTVSAAAQTTGAGSVTIRDLGGTDDHFVLEDVASTLTNKTLTTPTIGSFTNAQHDHSDAAGGGSLSLSMSDLGDNARGSMIRGDTSGDWEAFAKGSAHQLVISDGTDVAWGDPTQLNAASGVTMGGATTPSVTTATGKTNTGYFLVNGKTSGSIKLTCADATAQDVVLSAAAQSTGGCTVSIPDCGGVSDNLVLDDIAATLTNKTLTSPVIGTGLTASGSASNDFSGSTGTFKTSSGANTLSGEVTIADAANPDLNLAAGKTNTGNVTINGKTSGSLVITTADETAQAVTVTAAAQTTGATTLTIPDMAGDSDTFVFLTDAQTLTNKTLTTPTIGDFTNAGHDHMDAAGGAVLDHYIKQYIPMSNFWQGDAANLVERLGIGTTPVLDMLDGDTDSSLAITWAIGDQTPVLVEIPLEMVDGSTDLVIGFDGDMGGATDTPTIAVDSYFGRGDTKVEDTTSALGATWAEETVTIGNADIPDGSTLLTVELTPDGHGNDTLSITQFWVKYKRTNIGTSS